MVDAFQKAGYATGGVIKGCTATRDSAKQTNCGDIFRYDYNAETHDRISKIGAGFAAWVKRQFGNQKIDIVAHSMGSLVTRYAIKGYSGSAKYMTPLTEPLGGQVVHWVSLAGPNNGRPKLSEFCVGVVPPTGLCTEAVADMAFGLYTNFLGILNGDVPTPTPTMYRTYRSPCDEMVPEESVRLEGASNRQVSCPDHDGMLSNADAIDGTVAFLDPPSPGPGHVYNMVNTGNGLALAVGGWPKPGVKVGLDRVGYPYTKWQMVKWGNGSVGMIPDTYQTAAYLTAKNNQLSVETAGNSNSWDLEQAPGGAYYIDDRDGPNSLCVLPCTELAQFQWYFNEMPETFLFQGGVDADFRILQRHEGGYYQARYSLTSHSDKPIDNWSVDLTLPHGVSVDTVWGAARKGRTRTDQQGRTVVTLIGVGDLAPGRPVQVVYSGNAPGLATDPTPVKVSGNDA